MIQRKPNLAKSAPRIKSRQQQSDPSDADAPDSRERIVLAASNFFLTGGYNGVGIAEICEAASVHKGTFYHFFPSKTELLLVVIDRRVAVVEDAILTIAGRTDTPERKILALFAMPQDRLGQDQPRDFQSPGQFLGNIILELASTNPPVRTAARKALDPAARRGRPHQPAGVRCRGDGAWASPRRHDHGERTQRTAHHAGLRAYRADGPALGGQAVMTAKSRG
jgi:AcrR family transcriptional regulator